MKKYFSNVRLSLHTKIILPYLILSFSLALGAAYIITQIVVDSIEERFVNQLIDAGKLSSAWIVREEDRLLGTVRLIANTQGLPEIVRSQDSESLRELIFPIAINEAEEQVHILNTQGRSLLSMYHRPEGNIEDYEFTKGEEGYENFDFVQKVLSGQSDNQGDRFAGLLQTSRGAFFYVAGPILDQNNQLVGAVLVGKSTQSMVERIRAETLAHVSIYNVQGQSFSTTLFEPPQINLEIASNILTRQENESFIRRVSIINIDYREILGPLEARGGQDLGVLGVAFAENFLVRLSQNTWGQILFFITVALLLVVTIGFFIANHIAQPILNLNQAAMRVAGGDLAVHVNTRGNDEIANLAHEFNSMVSNLQRSKLDLVTAYDKTLEGWAKALELRDGETKGHSVRVTHLTLKLSRMMGMPEEELIHIQRGALIHDIGKMAIPDHILLKPGPLTDQEWQIMHQHPVYAVEMLRGIPFLRPALIIPAYHHERWNGTGYPFGLKEEQIPLAARIFSVIDAWDALRSNRPYRKALSEQESVQIIQQESERCFDPKVVYIFLKMIHGRPHPETS